MTAYAAYDEVSIYALGHTPKAAIQNARNEAREPDAEFQTAEIDEDLAAWIDENGWNGKNRSFELRDGIVVDTTDE